MIHPTSTCCSDCRYWGLSRRETVAHHLRLADYYLRQSKRFLDDADMYGRRARRQLLVGTAFLLAAFFAQLIKRMA